MKRDQARGLFKELENSRSMLRNPCRLQERERERVDFRQREKAES